MTTRIHFPCAVSDFIITSDNSTLINAIRALYRCSEQATKKPCRHIAIKQDGACFKVTFEDAVFETEHPLRMVQNILFEQQAYLPELLPLHAGAVAVGGKAYIFLASTGTGKTTLITYLAASGCRYLNDDRVFVCHDSLTCVADVTPVHLRPESIPVLKKYGCEINGELVEAESIRRVIWMPPAIVSEDVPVGGLYFISRSDCENSVNPLSGGEAVQRLMQNLLCHDGSSNSLRCAIKLARYCKELKYADMSYVCDVIKREAGVI